MDGPPAPRWFVVPTLATVLTIYSLLHSMEHEPFGNFDWYDAVIQVGIPVVSLGLWIVWSLCARRRQMPLAQFLGFIVWAAIQLSLGFVLAVVYFEEPWNRP